MVDAKVTSLFGAAISSRTLNTTLYVRSSPSVTSYLFWSSLTSMRVPVGLTTSTVAVAALASYSAPASTVATKLPVGLPARIQKMGTANSTVSSFAAKVRVSVWPLVETTESPLAFSTIRVTSAACAVEPARVRVKVTSCSSRTMLVKSLARVMAGFAGSPLMVI